LRFHVQLEHKWKEYADLGGWQAWILDSRGRRYLPEQIDSRKPDLVVFMWDQEVRSVSRNYGDRGDIVSMADDGYKNRQPLGSLSMFRGRGDYVFYARDIFTPDIRWITLIVERRGMAFTFTWKFADPPGTSSPRRVVARQIR
jgi:signal peptidase I